MEWVHGIRYLATGVAKIVILECAESCFPVVQQCISIPYANSSYFSRSRPISSCHCLLPPHVPQYVFSFFYPAQAMSRNWSYQVIKCIWKFLTSCRFHKSVKNHVAVCWGAYYNYSSSLLQTGCRVLSRPWRWTRRPCPRTSTTVCWDTNWRTWCSSATSQSATLPRGCRNWTTLKSLPSGMSWLGRSVSSR